MSYSSLAKVMVVLSFIQFGRWYYAEIPFFICYVINFLPAVVLYICNQVTFVFEGKIWRFFAVIATIISLGLWVMTNIFMEVVGPAMTEVTRASRYTEIMKKWGDSSYVQHFPPTIPEDAANVHFSFYPGPLQAEGHMQLSYTTSPENISRLYERFNAMKTNSSLTPSIFFRTGELKNTLVPEDFEIMVLGLGCGVAISKGRNEILYWAKYD